MSSATGGYLASHPGANDVVTDAGALAPQDGENSIRAYFVSHPQEERLLRTLKGLQTELGRQVRGGR